MDEKRTLQINSPSSVYTRVYKWVPANIMLGVTLRWTSISLGGVEMLPVASCYVNRDKLRPDGPLGSYTDFTFPFTMCLTENSLIDRIAYYYPTG